MNREIAKEIQSLINNHGATLAVGEHVLVELPPESKIPRGFPCEVACGYKIYKISSDYSIPINLSIQLISDKKQG